MGSTEEPLILADTSNPADWVRTLRHLMTFDESNAGLAIIDDVDQDEAANSLRDLVWRANHDSLTMLSNRAWFLQCSESSRNAIDNTGHSHVLLVMDLDGFKEINDTRGHAAGDAVLAEIGHRLRAMSRPGDVIGRMGGDEFAIWVERVAPSAANDLAQRYLGVFEHPIEHNDVDITARGSIGVVVTDGTQPLPELIDLADSALYEAKSRGPLSVCLFDRTLQARIDETHAREREITNAVLNDEFEFDIQPIVDLTNDVPAGYEVLARWNSPRRGRLMPAEFLQYIRSTNLSSAFDAMIIEKAARAMQSWRFSLRSPRSIWINISPTQLEAALPTLVAEIIERYGINRGELVFELTEHATANTPGRIAVLSALRDLGIQVAIDDFGTGHSQLSYLQDLPIDFVKLDRSFISGFHSEPRRVAITKSIVDLAQALGAKVVAEGVERPEELAMLREIGCDHAQGYLLCPPGRPSDLLGL